MNDKTRNWILELVRAFLAALAGFGGGSIN